MDKIAEGIASMAEAISKGSTETITKETADSTIQGQAQEKIQDEGCLTIEGQLLILDQLTDATLARTYLITKKDELRARWLKQQILKYIASGGEGEIGLTRRRANMTKRREQKHICLAESLN